MKQIKIFSNFYYSKLEEQVNEFLKQNKDKYELIDLSFSHIRYMVVILIFM